MSRRRDKSALVWRRWSAKVAAKFGAGQEPASAQSKSAPEELRGEAGSNSCSLMNADDLLLYEYQPLPEGLFTRYLELQPGDGPLRCNLSVGSIEQMTGRYEAISYVWGDPERKTPVIVDGTAVYITENLRDALQTFRDQTQPRLLWADAICINQNDPKERGHQVEHMGEIYRNASCVLVWVDEDPDSWAADCFDLIRETNLYFRKYLDVYGDVRDVPPSQPNGDQLRTTAHKWEAVRELFDRQWFKRVWVLQEVGLATHALLHWGKAHIEWFRIVEFALLRNYSYCLFPLTPNIASASVCGAFERFWLGLRCPSSWQFQIPYWSGSRLENVKYTLLDVLDLGSMFRASDSRDHVYALSNYQRVKDLHTKMSFAVDYTKPAEEIFFETAVAILRSEEDPARLLSFVKHGTEYASTSERRLSWVPQWDERPVLNLIGYTELGRVFNRGQQLSFKHQVTTTKELKLQGSKLDHVAWRSQLLHGQEFELVRPQGIEPALDSLWATVASQDTKRCYASLTDRREAFRQVLECGFSDFWHLFNQADGRTDTAVFETYCDALRNGSQPDVSDRRVRYLERRISVSVRNRTFICMQSGGYSLGPTLTRLGDECWFFPGAAAPFVLRKWGTKPGRYKLVGECYVDGMMHGEPQKMLEEGKFQLQDVFLA